MPLAEATEAIGLAILMLFTLPSARSSNMRRPSRPTADDQSALPENRPESKTHKGVGVAASQNIEISKKGYAAFDPSWANLVHIVAVDLGQCFGEVVG